MKLGSSTVKKGAIGAAVSLGAYLGYTSLTQAPDSPEPTAYPLYDAGEYATSTLAATPYTPALTGTVFDVRDYGATVNDDTNDIEEIQAAITACGVAGGGTVYIPAGTYVIFPDAVEEASFTLHYSNVRIEGDGPTQTILNFRAWGGADPAGAVFKRGNGFTTLGAPGAISNITIRGLRGTGNAPPTENAGQVDYEEGTQDGWDVWHKGVAVFYSVENFIVEDCEWDNWRGEALYGGGEDKTITVRRNLVRGCNASAISLGGVMSITGNEIYNVHNATECFAFDVGSMVVEDNLIEPNRVPEGAPEIGVYGVVYLGFPEASLTVDSNTIKRCNSAIFISEMGSNVTITNNTIEDAQGIYAAFQDQYDDAGVIDAAENTFDDWIVQGNTITAVDRDIEYFMLGLTDTQNNWLVDDNTAISTGENKLTYFYGMPSAAGSFAITANAIEDAIPVLPYTGTRPTWTTNTVTGDYALGTIFVDSDARPEGDPWSIYPAWPGVDVRYTRFAQMTRIIEVDPTKLADYPTGFRVEIRRTGENSTVRGLEVVPDASWNTLTQGYMIYDGAVLVLQKEAGGKFEFVSYTPPTPYTVELTQLALNRNDANDMAFMGQGATSLIPSAAHTFDTYSGVAEGETVTITYNANSTIDHQAGVIELWNSTDFVSAGTGTLTATRVGTALQIADPAALDPLTEDFADRLAAEGYTLTGGEQTAYNDLIDAGQANGWLEHMREMMPFEGTDTDHARVKLVYDPGDASNLTAVGYLDADVRAEGGMYSATAGRYWTTIAADELTNTHGMGYFVRDDQYGFNATGIGLPNDETPYLLSAMISTGSSQVPYNNWGGAEIIDGITVGRGVYRLARTSLTALAFMVNLDTLATSSTSISDTRRTQALRIGESPMAIDFAFIDDGGMTTGEYEAFVADVATLMEALGRVAEGSGTNIVPILGQSLADGSDGAPQINAAPVTGHHNRMFLKGAASETAYTFGPLGERQQETIAFEMANTASALRRVDVADDDTFDITVTNWGLGSAGYSSLEQGTARYNSTIAAIASAKEVHDILYPGTFRCPFVALVHGETDWNSDTYQSDLTTWQVDKETDIKAITGQTGTIPFIYSQISAWTSTGNGNSATAKSPYAQLAAHVANPSKLILVGPKYFIPHSGGSSGVHLENTGYNLLGGYYGKAQHAVMSGDGFTPLRPTSISRSGATITVSFAGRVGNLVLDDTAVSDPGNYGFEWAQTGGTARTISSVALINSNTQLTVTLSGDPGSPSVERLRYAYTGTAGNDGGPTTGPRGCLRDSDTTESYSGDPLPNWLVHFDYPIGYADP